MAAAMTVLVAQTALWLVLGLSSFLFAIAMVLALVVYFAAFDGVDDVGDVQRFIELRDEARTLVPPGLPLFDAKRQAATADAIGRFQAKKDEARRALRPSGHGRRPVAIEAVRVTPGGVPIADPRSSTQRSRSGGVR
jgi:hypothetical protein